MDMPNHYQIKYRRKGRGENWKFGIFDRSTFDEEVVKLWKNGECVIADAVLPRSTIYRYEDLEIIDIPLGLPSYDMKTQNIVPGDEYGEYVQREYNKAVHKSMRSEGLENKLFSVGVADGSAYYVVVRENKKTVRVQWRGFCPDRYTDAVLGWECTVEKERIADMIRREEGMRELFAKK